MQIGAHILAVHYMVSLIHLWKDRFRMHASQGWQKHGFMSIAQPSEFYWENPGFTRVILGFTGFTG